MKVWWKKEYTLFSVWKAPMAYLAWKMLGTLSRFRWGMDTPPQMFLSQIFRFELWHLYKSLLPSAKGLSFTIMQLLF